MLQVIIQCYSALLLRLFQLWLLGALLVDSCVTLIYPHHCGFLCFFDSFLTLWHHKML